LAERPSRCGQWNFGKIDQEAPRLYSPPSDLALLYYRDCAAHISRAGAASDILLLAGHCQLNYVNSRVSLAAFVWIGKSVSFPERVEALLVRRRHCCRAVLAGCALFLLFGLTYREWRRGAFAGTGGSSGVLTGVLAGGVLFRAEKTFSTSTIGGRAIQSHHRSDQRRHRHIDSATIRCSIAIPRFLARLGYTSDEAGRSFCPTSLRTAPHPRKAYSPIAQRRFQIGSEHSAGV